MLSLPNYKVFYKGVNYTDIHQLTLDTAKFVVSDGRKVWQAGKAYFIGCKASVKLLASEMGVDFGSFKG